MTNKTYKVSWEVSKYAIIDKGISNLYNSFVKNLEQDKDYSLCDDENSELFNELLLKYMRNTMSNYEWTRVIDSIK